MYHIESAAIDGFWGAHTAATDFHPDVNIFIGKNGSGKTTFIELLQGVLRADLRALASYEFDEIRIKLVAGGSRRTVRVTREHRQEPMDLLRFQIGTTAHHIPSYSSDMDTRRHFNARPRLVAILHEIKRALNEVVSVASVSVHRADLEPPIDEDYRSRGKSTRPPIDERLESLLRALTVYQLSLAERANVASTEFQREVLLSILYDKKFDAFTPRDLQAIDLVGSKEQLVRAYKEMGAFDKRVEQRITTHIDAIGRAVSAWEVGRKTEQGPTFAMADVLALPLAKRSTHIVELLSRTEENKQQVFRSRETYLETVRQFFQDKSIGIGADGELRVERQARRIDIPNLSSGEKQLLILLTETLLQKEQRFVMIADEPELSLHIEWQSGVIDAIRRLNSQAQVVVATHSPEIVAGWQERVIDMKDVVRA